MRTIEGLATITANGQLTVRVPAEIPAGEHQVVVVIDERPLATLQRPPLDFPVDDYGPWPAELALRREDMYDDHGR